MEVVLLLWIWFVFYVLVGILIGAQFSISTYAVGASLLAALSVVLESLSNRCMKLVHRVPFEDDFMIQIYYGGFCLVYVS